MGGGASRLSPRRSTVWSIKHTDGSNQSYGYSSGGGSQNVPGNVYYWEVQNQGSDPQAWEVCFNG
jgi:hypothetical protein